MNSKILKGFIRAERKWFDEWERGEMSFGFLCQRLAEMIDDIYRKEVEDMRALEVKNAKHK